MSKPQRNEQLRQQFAIHANKLGPWLERSLDTLFAAQTSIAAGHLEQQLGTFHKMEDEVNRMRPTLYETERCYQVGDL